MSFRDLSHRIMLAEKAKIIYSLFFGNEPKPALKMYLVGHEYLESLPLLETDQTFEKKRIPRSETSDKNLKTQKSWIVGVSLNFALI